MRAAAQVRQASHRGIFPIQCTFTRIGPVPTTRPALPPAAPAPTPTTTSRGLVPAAAAAPAAGAGSGLRGSRPSLLSREANFSPLRSPVPLPLLLLLLVLAGAAADMAGIAVVSTVAGGAEAAAAAAKPAKGLAAPPAPAAPNGLAAPPNGGMLRRRTVSQEWTCMPGELYVVLDNAGTPRSPSKVPACSRHHS